MKSIATMSPMPSAISVAQLMTAPCAGSDSCPSVERSGALGDVDAVGGGHPDEQPDRADQDQRHLDDRGVGVGDQTAGSGVGHRDRRDQDHTQPVRHPEEVVEQQAAGHQVAGDQHAERDGQQHRRPDLDLPAEPQPVVVGERRQSHPVHRLGEEDAGDRQAQRQTERQAGAGPEPELERQVGVAEGGVGVDGRAHERAADQPERQHAAADEEVGAVAFDLFGDIEADEHDNSDADAYAEKNHRGAS